MIVKIAPVSSFSEPILIKRFNDKREGRSEGGRFGGRKVGKEKQERERKVITKDTDGRVLLV